MSGSANKKSMLERLSWIAGILSLVLASWIYLSTSETSKAPTELPLQQTINKSGNISISFTNEGEKVREPLFLTPGNVKAPGTARYSNDAAVRYIVLARSDKVVTTVAQQSQDSPTTGPQREPDSRAADLFGQRTAVADQRAKVPDKLNKTSPESQAEDVTQRLLVQFIAARDDRPIFPGLEDAFQFALSPAPDSTAVSTTKQRLSQAIANVNTGRDDEARAILSELSLVIPVEEVGLNLYSKLLLSFLTGKAQELILRDPIVVAAYRTSSGRPVLSYINARTGDLVGLSDTFIDGIDNFSIRTDSRGYTYFEAPVLGDRCGTVFLLHLGSGWTNTSQCGK